MIKSVVRFFLFILLFSLTACGRQNFSDILSQREIERFYLSPEFNDNFGFDTEAFIVTEGQKDRLLVVPHSTDFSKLIPSHEIEGYALFIDRARQTSGKDIVNFADDKRYTIYSYDGKSEDFNVSAKEPDAYFTKYSFMQSHNDSFAEESIADITIDVDKDGAKHEMRLSSVWFYLPQSLLKKIGYRLVPNIELGGIDTTGASVYVVDSEGKESAFVSGSTVCDFSEPLRMRVRASDGTYIDYKVSPYLLKSIVFRGGDNDSFGNSEKDCKPQLIDEGLIEVKVPTSANLKKLTASFEYMGDTISFNGEAVAYGETNYTGDFSKDVTLSVTTKMGQSRNYTLRVIPDPAPYVDADPGELRLRSLVTEEKTATVKWYLPPDDDLDHIDVVFNGVTQTLAGNAVSVQVDGLVNNNIYELTLQCFDTAGNASPKSKITIDTFVSYFGDKWLFIYNADDLNAVRGGQSTYSSEWNLNANYQMMVDIDLAAEGYPNWQPITGGFQGRLFGNGKKIIINRIVDYWPAAFIDTVSPASSAEIRDVIINVTDRISCDFANGAAILVAINEGTIKGCKVSGHVSGIAKVGGLVSNNTVNGKIFDCSADGEIIVNYAPSGNENFGGLVGNNYGLISRSYANVSINAVRPYASAVGGLVGYHQSGIIEQCYATGNVTLNSSFNPAAVGGLVGYMTGGTIKQCYATGDVNCVGNTARAGGLVGNMVGGTIENCYSSAVLDVQGGASYAGGIAGYSGGIINYCYAVGRITGEDAKGGIVAGIGGFGWSHCFYDEDTTGWVAGWYDIGYRRITSVMMKKSTYTISPLIWDFTNIWYIDEDNDYPRLRGVGGQ